MYRLIAVCLMVFVVGLDPALVSGTSRQGSSGFQCTINSVTCGRYVTTATESSVCGVVELAKVGNLPDKQYTKITLFGGFRAGQEILIIGGGSVKAGILISCRVPWGKSGPSYGTLKNELPALLKKHPEIQKRFPEVKQIIIDPELRFEQFTPADVNKIKSQADYLKHRFWK